MGAKQIKYVLFTGAGASKAIGLPTMKEFFEIILKNKTDKTAVRVSVALKEMFPDFNTNYDLEEIMGALYEFEEQYGNYGSQLMLNDNVFIKIAEELRQAFHVRTRENTLTYADQHIVFEMMKDKFFSEQANLLDNVKKLTEDLEFCIRCAYENINDEENYRVYGSFISKLIKEINLPASTSHERYVRMLPIYTTNYDRSIEELFDITKIEHISDDSGINPTPKTKWKRLLQFTPIEFIDGFDEQTWYREQYKLNARDKKFFVPYYKLHGSLYWERKDAQQKIERFQCGINIGGNREDLLMIYPSNKKEIFTDPYYYSHQCLDRDLLQAKKLIVIGFSFRDPKIVEMFKMALKHNKGLSIKVIAPSDSWKYPELNAFIEHDRVEHLQYNFGKKDTEEELFEKIIQ